MQENSAQDDSLPGKQTSEANSTRHRIAIVVATLIVSAIVTVPFFFSRHSPGSSSKQGITVIQTHDLGNLLAMMDQFDRVLRSGVLYPRWTPNWNKGYGSANLNFYPPFLFYILSLVRSVVNDWVDTVFIVSMLSLAASGIAFYFLSRTFHGRPASTIAALIYMLLPFHQMDLYWRGGITQFVGYVFLPLVLYAAFKLGSEGRLRYFAAFGFVHGLYIMTHLPVSYIFSYVLAVYAVLWSVTARDLKILMRLGGGMALALVFSAIYWLPAALEARHAYEWVTETFPYHYLYITLIPVSDEFSKLIQMILTFHAVALITVIIILRKTAIVRSEDSFQNADAAGVNRIQMRLWIIMGIATTVMTTSFSIYVSKLIPKIQLAVPPFRWLAVASLFLALLVAAAADRLWSSKRLPSKLLLTGRIALGLAITLNLWWTVKGVVVPKFSHPSHVQPDRYADSGGIPRNSTLPHLLDDTEPVIVKPEAEAVELIQWLPTHREFVVRVNQPSEMRIKTYNFPGWTASIDGQRVPLLSDSDGVQLLPLPAGRHKIETDFVDTPPRKIGAVLFGIGLLAIAGLAVVDHRRVREKRPADLDSAVTSDAALPAAVDSNLRQDAAGVVPTRMRFVAASLILVAAVVAGYILLRSGSDSRPAQVAEPEKTAGVAPAVATGSSGVGSEGRLSVGGGSSILVAVDEKALDDLIESLSTRNHLRVEELTRAGRLIRVNSNTRVRILEFGSSKVKVRILEGESITLDGWVPDNWIKWGES